MISLTVNGKSVQFDGDPSMPLLWFLRDVQGLTGTKFGCGVAQCGACTVHLDGQPRRSCVTPIGTIDGATVTTIEGAGRQGRRGGAGRVGRARRAAMRLLPVGPDHVGGRAAVRDRRSRPTTTSTSR